MCVCSLSPPLTFVFHFPQYHSLQQSSFFIVIHCNFSDTSTTLLPLLWLLRTCPSAHSFILYLLSLNNSIWSLDYNIYLWVAFSFVFWLQMSPQPPHLLLPHGRIAIWWVLMSKSFHFPYRICHCLHSPNMLILFCVFHFGTETTPL